MTAGNRVVLDACVLIPMPLADTLLRMAEEPALYLPMWSRTIMDEVTRNLIGKWGMPLEKARRREEVMRIHFPEVWVEGYEPLLDGMPNHPGDRHVLAAAVCSNSRLIVTYNRRHFQADSLRPWRIDVQGPSMFLRRLYDVEPGLFVEKLREQAAPIRVAFETLLQGLSTNVPGFVDYFCREQRIGFPMV